MNEARASDPERAFIGRISESNVSSAAAVPEGPALRPSLFSSR
jgi:hypothetical protein